MTRLFTYDFESFCNIKPLEPLPGGAKEIARDVYRMPEWKRDAAGTSTPTSGADLVALADWRGVNATNLHVKRQWQTYYNVRTMPGGAAREH